VSSGLANDDYDDDDDDGDVVDVVAPVRESNGRQMFPPGPRTAHRL
jgi:hypothetical protein